MTGGIIKSNENVKVVIIQIPTCTRIEPQMLHNAVFTTITCHKLSVKDHVEFESIILI